MKTTLRIKLIIFSTLLVTVIMVSVTYLFTIRELESKRTAVASQIRRIAQNIATTQLLDRQDWSVYQNYISQLMTLNPDIVYIAIFDDRNTLRAHSLNHTLVEIDHSPFTRRAEAEIVKQLDRGGIAKDSQQDLRTERVNILAGDRVLGSVHLGFSVIDINRELRHGILLNAGLGLFFILLSSLVAVVAAGRLTRPLEGLNQAMQAVNEGDLEQIVTPVTHDEIADLTRSFNAMVTGLRERQIIETLGYELSLSFQFDRLALLVRDRLNRAIGAAGARMYIKKRGDGDHFEEITSGDGKFSPFTLCPETQSFLQTHREGFMVFTAPPQVLHDLRHTPDKEDGLVIPMMVKDQLFGLLFFALPPEQRSYTRKQMHFAATLAGQAALALENTLLYESLREQERMKRELEIAREMQQKLLPARMPQIPDFQFDGVCLPAREVGGDYYDFFRLSDGQLGVAIADVSGHGASASFYMAEIKGMMLHLSESCRSPRQLLAELNKKLYQNLERGVFVTMTYGVLDISRQRFTFARAGHSPLLILSKDGVSRFCTPPGIGLGLDSGTRFDTQLEEVAYTLQTGDTLVFFTDGVVEAMNQQNEIYGEQRFLQSLNAGKSAPLEKVRQNALKALRNFTNGAPQGDDITLVMVRYQG